MACNDMGATSVKTKNLFVLLTYHAKNRHPSPSRRLAGCL